MSNLIEKKFFADRRGEKDWKNFARIKVKKIIFFFYNGGVKNCNTVKGKKFLFDRKDGNF